MSEEIKSVIVAARDVKSDGFTRPQFFPTVEAAMRAFEVAVTGGDQTISEFPDDYTLYYLGQWDDDTGIFKTKPPERIYTAFEALRAAKIREHKRQSLEAEIQQLNGVDNGPR